MRALEALVSLGARVASKDAQQIAALARQNDSAAIEAVEELLASYTIACASIDSEDLRLIQVGGRDR
jgi:hypothetical protein